MNRQESIGRKMDFERLKRMKTGGKQEQTKPLNKPVCIYIVYLCLV